jgi:heme exporter protein A
MAASTCIEVVTALSGLAIDNLSLARGDRVLLRGLAFRLSAGQTLSLEGPNGIGKTSLLRAIAGFLPPSAGTIRLEMTDGAAIGSDEERARCIGWLGHVDGAKPQLTAIEVLRFFARFYGNGREHDVEQTLARVGLARIRDLPLQYLSAGQKKRLALARLTVSDRPLWLLDEPLAALDAAGKALAAQLIAAHCRSGGLAVAATHEPLGLDAARLVLGPSPPAPAAARPSRLFFLRASRPWCRWASAPISDCWAASRAACCGLRRYLQPFSRSTGCFRAISRMAASISLPWARCRWKPWRWPRCWCIG